MKIIAIALIALLAACATPDGMKEIRTKEKIVYDLPPETVERLGTFSGLSFNTRAYEFERSGFKYLRDTKVTPHAGDQCQVSFMTFIVPTAKQATQSPGIAYNSYIFKVNKKSRRGITTLEFIPQYEVLEPVVTFKSARVSPPHSIESAMEAIATSGVMTFQFEIDSPLNSASVKKNLQKYFRKDTLREQPFSFVNKTFTESYLLAISGNPLATFYVSLHPREKGTHAVVVAILHLAPDADYHINAIDQANDIKKVVSDAIAR